MSKVAFDYPKSSSDFYQCQRKMYPSISNINPTNLSISNCQLPEVFECYNKVPFNYSLEPNPQKGYIMLNPNSTVDRFASDFKKIYCPGSKGCSKIQYYSTDPRLKSAAHSGQVITLDRPPQDSTVKINDTMTDASLDNFGQKYKTYSDINAGYITYYVNKELSDPYFEPLFSTTSKITSSLYNDPMGGIKPEYDRESLISQNMITSTKDHYEGGLSWIQDSTNHRESLMATQMGKQNREKWASRWYNNS